MQASGDGLRASARTEAAARAAFTAFCEVMRTWMPPTISTSWDAQSDQIKAAWIAAAAAALKHEA